MAPGDDTRRGSRHRHDALLADFIGGHGSGGPAHAATDVYLTEDPAAINVTVDVAGLDPQSLEVVLDQDLLIVRGERRRPAAASRRIYQHVEIDWGTFERRIRLGSPVDPAAAAVSYERGLLQIALPLAPRHVVTRVLIGVRIPG